MALIDIEDLQKRPPLKGWAPFALGFRPFFLAAGLYAVVLMVTWILLLNGHYGTGAIPPFVWHGHEMLFGFTVAVIAGFLLTAAQNWTGIRTPHGRPLVLLFALWLAGRLAFLIPGVPAAVTAVADLVFLPALAFALALPIGRARQLHNYPFPVLLAVLAVANALVHLELLHVAGTAWLGLHLATYAVVAMIVLMGGRVIPSFTDNKLQTRARRWKAVEVLVPVVTLAALLAALAAPLSPITALLAALAAAVHLVRLGGWYTARYWRVPLLWVLHLGYAWIVAGFALLALAAMGSAGAASASLHAFTAGGIGVLTLGMMARVSLGHSGRMLEIAPVIAWAFVAVNLAALARVAAPLLLTDVYVAAMGAAGALWIAAFGLFAAVYVPILMRPRVDGKPG